MQHRIPGAIVALLGAILVAHPVVAQDDPVEIEGLVVTATPIPLELTSLGSHITVLEADDLRSRGLMRVTDALRSVPGISVAENGSMGSVTSVFMRGGESDQVQVMIDGVQVNQPGGSFDFSGLELASVERIEIVRGPASALHGSDAVAGVIHIITRDGASGAPSSASIRAGSYGRLDGTLSVNGGDADASYGFTLGRYTTDGILAFNNGHENTVLTGKAAFRLAEQTTARLSGRIGDRQYSFPTDFSGAVVDENQFTFNDETSLSVEVEQGLGDRAALRVLATSYSVDAGTDDAPDGPADTLGFFGFQSLDSYRRNALDLRTNVRLGDGVTATLGGEYEEQRVRSFNESASAFGISTGRSANERSNRAGYLHLTGGRGALAGNAGVRVEDNELYGGFVSWQAGLSWTVSPVLRFRSAAGRGIKEPTFFETFAQGFTVGNPALDPEISTSFEVGVESTLLQDRLTLQATGFRQELEDLIQYTGTPPAPGEPNYFNVAGARAQGLELGATLRAGIFSVGVDGTWLDTEVTDAGFDEGPGATFVNGERLLRRPDFTGTVRLDANPVPALRVGVQLQHVGERADRDFNAFPAEAVTLEAYQLLGASLEWSVLNPGRDRTGLAVTLAGRNLADESYQDVFGFRAPGRILTVGARVTLGR